MRGDESELTRSLGVGSHHTAPISYIRTVDDKVRLLIAEDQAKDHGREVKH